MAVVTRSKANESESQSTSAASEPTVGATDAHVGMDYSQMSVHDLISSISEINKDPVISEMLAVLSEKIPKDITVSLADEKRSRSIVFAGIKESEGDLPPSKRQAQLEQNVSQLLDALDIECKPCEVFRMGKVDSARPRLVKVVLPTVAHWRTALRNARNLRLAGFTDIFVRRSMTKEERKQDYELRQIAKDRNKGKSTKEWVVFRGQLKHVSELPSRNQGNV